MVLHEAGHVILRQSPNFTSAFPDSSRTTLAGRIEILREEVVAWNKAEELINKFGISHSEYFDREKWKQNYRSALSQYALWVESGDKNEES